MHFYGIDENIKQNVTTVLNITKALSARPFDSATQGWDLAVIF